MLASLKRFLNSFRGEPLPDPLKAVQPRVTPDPLEVAALEKRFSELAYEPENGFERDRVEQRCRSTVVSFRRRRA